MQKKKSAWHCFTLNAPCLDTAFWNTSKLQPFLFGSCGLLFQGGAIVNGQFERYLVSAEKNCKKIKCFMSKLANNAEIGPQKLRHILVDVLTTSTVHSYKVYCTYLKNFF